MSFDLSARSEAAAAGIESATQLFDVTDEHGQFLSDGVTAVV